MYFVITAIKVHEMNMLISRLAFHGLLYYILTSHIKISTVISFNIDEEYPIVIKNSFDGENAHFGIAVNLLSNINRDRDPREAPTGWVLISAPKANSTYLNHSGIYEPGVIWRCGLGRYPGARTDDCRIMEMDPTREFDPRTPGLPEKGRRDGGWLGGAMIVGDSDRFIACASRWVNQKYPNSYLMNGMCSWTTKEEVRSDDVDKLWPRLGEKSSNRLGPLLSKYRQEVNVLNNSLLNDWSMGQSGFSLAIAKNNEMVIGAPGVFEWTGTVIQFKDAKTPRKSHRRFNMHPRTSAFSEVVVARVQKPNKPSTVLSYYDYFGYSVAVGNFFDSSASKNRTQYAAGAPRSGSLSGKVLLFSFRETDESSTAELDYLIHPIEAPNGFGEHYGSYFGSVLAAGDINDDGFDDLLVGAPLFGTIYNNQLLLKKPSDIIEVPDPMPKHHSNVTINITTEEKPEKIWKMASGDEGCVFVYSISSSRRDFKQPPQVICGDRIPGARFGSAISVLGDINWDGYKDIAVGAPYENDNHGAVYIYHGGKVLMFAQKLLPKYIDPGIRTFGYSLSSGVDIDGNLYPDLAVGAYQSNHVVIFRTIPLVKFATNVSSTIPKLLPTTHDFNITVCVSFSGQWSIPDSLDLVIKLSINHDTHYKQFLTWISHESTDRESQRNGSHLLQQRLTTQRLLNFSKEGSCHNFTARRIGDVDDITQAINIGMTYWIDGSDKDRRTQPLTYTITANSEGNPQLNFNRSQPDFHEFPLNKLPISNTNLFGSSLLSIGTICDEDGNPSCLANLTFQAVFRDHNSVAFHSQKPFTLGSSGVLTLELDLWNHREIARLPITVDFSWNSPPTIKRAGADCNELARAVNSRYKCHINRAIKEGRRESLHMEFDMSGIYAGEVHDSIVFHVTANSSSELVAKAVHTIELPLQYRMEVLNFSYGYETEYFTNMTAETFNISHLIEINLHGPTPIYKAQAEIDIPKFIEIDGQSHEFVLVREPFVDYDGISYCTAVNGSFFQEPLSDTFGSSGPRTATGGQTEDSLDGESNEDLTYRTFTREVEQISQNASKRKKRSRTKRDALEPLHSIFNLDSNLEGEYGVFKLGCGDTRVTCMKVVCDLKHFHEWSKAVIELKLRLKNSVTKILMQEYNDVESITLETLGVLRMIDRNGQAFGDFANLNVTTRLRIPEPFEIPAWILIVSIAGGLLLLTFIILILVRCGFFQRAKRKELEFLKANEQADRYFM